MTGAIKVERSAHVATVVIDNVAKRNAMSQAMWIAIGSRGSVFICCAPDAAHTERFQLAGPVLRARSVG